MVSKVLSTVDADATEEMAIKKTKTKAVEAKAIEYNFSQTLIYFSSQKC
jgi:hypothetical protein